MEFELSSKTKELQQRLQSFMNAYVYPNERRFHEEIERERWKPTRIIEELIRRRAKRGCGICFCRTMKTAQGSPTWSTRRFAKSWGAVTWRPRCSIVRRQIPGIWKCWHVTARRSKRKNG